ncbi:YCF48-related protein [Pseudomonas sp. GCM10022188]|uniref:YCF48-related protein n=1 Tax=Pseudomonas TaxID=286 RepID=UPI001E5AD03C|nr:YCF48-related protein [Pseudomonas oryzagri]MCC6075434.1 YCF48-related protein [Pseudomonas oryzagri]
MRQLIAYAMSAVVAATAAYAFSHRTPPPLPATQLRTDRLLINDMAVDGRRVVAVGEQGIVLTSDDLGETWQQASIEPRRSSSLTGVVVLSADHLVAVGHDGWILRSENGGKSWQEVRIDSELAEPLLGVWAGDANHVVAYGSYGKFFVSADGGKTWQARELPVDGYHLNGMDGGADGRQMLVGEQGTVLRSADGGQTWEALPAFYNGSLFGVARLSTERWLAYGMRGHVFVSHDFGQNWTQIPLGHSSPLYGHARLPGQTGVLVVGAGGVVTRFDGQGHLVDSLRLKSLGTLTSVSALDERVLVVGGEQGVFKSFRGGVTVAKD